MSERRSIRNLDWGALAAQSDVTLTSEQQTILALLRKGESTPSIAREIGWHRSAVWREVTRLRALLEEPEQGGTSNPGSR
jgi:DNA-binding NarL/FixJ family response regulator